MRSITTTALTVLSLVTAAALCAGPSAAASAAQPFEPVRRDAVIDVEELPPPLSPTPAFLFASMTLASATTQELADYARALGARAAAQWLCEHYVAPLDGDSATGSFQQMIDEAAATGAVGAAASNALVCPRDRPRLHEVDEHLENPGCIFSPFGGCHTVRTIVLSHVLAYPDCNATDAQRRSYGVDACEGLFYGASGRATALGLYLRRVRRSPRRCLQFRLQGGTVAIYVRATSCPNGT